MKKLLLATSMILVSIFSFAQTETTKTATAPAAEIKFEEVVFDFGTVVQGTPTVHEFVFTNTGNAPLILQNVNTSCGCTIPEWPKEPIMPGKSAKIKVVYDSNRLGSFSKTITVLSNGKTGTIYLTIKGNVEAKPAQPTSPVVVPNKG